MAKYEYTISRWHKITERLTAKAQTFSEIAKSTFCNTYVDGYAGDAQYNLLTSQADAAMTALAAHKSVLQIISIIRSEIGKHNAHLGIASLLAEQECCNRRIKLIKEILDAQRTEMVGIADLKEYRPFGEIAKSRISYRGDEPKGVINVRTLLDSHPLAVELAELQNRMYSLSDAVNDLNQKRVTIDLSDEMSAIIGIKEA